MHLTKKGLSPSKNLSDVKNAATARTNINAETLGAAKELADNQDIYGFVDNSETTISFNDTTYEFTLGVTDTTFRYYRNGQLNTITGAKTVTLPGTPPTATKYYITMNADNGALSQSTTAWNLTTSTAVPVAVICFNDTLTPKYCLSDERHLCNWTRNQHSYQHLTQGTRFESGGALSGYTVAPSSPADTDNTYQIAETIIWDENIRHTNAALTAENAFEIEYRSGAGTWLWESSDVPFRYTTSGYIQYDNAGTMTEGAAGNFYVTYLLATNAQGVHRFVHIHGQAAYASLTAAQNASFSDLTLTGLQYQEAIALWKLIWSTNASYSTKGKCRLAVAPIRVQTAIQSAGSIPGYGSMAMQNSDSVSISGGTVGGENVTNLKLSKLDATAAPTANDDSGDGYGVGSLWIDVTGDRTYRCVDATVGAAVWIETLKPASTAETTTGTETAKAVTPDGLAGSSIFGVKAVEAVVFDFATDCATGDGKFYFVIPPALNGMNLVGVHGRAITAGTTGTMDVQLRNVTDSVDMLSTKLTWDSTEVGTDTAATPYVIDTTKDDVASYDVIAVDVDAVQTTKAKGMIITLWFQLP